MPNVILLFGGRSAEHEVSILSARSVVAAAPKERIAITPMCIARDGRFVAPERSARILAGEEKGATGDADFSFELWSRAAEVDLVFPLIHGTGGCARCARSEEHTSELQSRLHLVCRLLLEKKKE